MSTEKSELQNERRMSLLQNFLCFCAGVDKSILNQCPTEWNKYSCIGATVLFTGILASLSGGYALFTVFQGSENATLFSVLFGLLWGLIIFNLDRFIVSTFKKVAKGEWWQRLLRELLNASPRIILAIIIAFVISKPVEIKIFEDRLSYQIAENMKDAQKGNNKDFTDIHGIPDKKKKITELEDKIRQTEEEKEKDPQNVIDLKEEKRLAEQKLANKRKENSSLVQKHRKDIASIKNNQNNYRPIYDNDGNIVEQSLTKEANEKIAFHNRAIRGLNNEIRTMEKNIDSLVDKITVARNEYRELKDKEIAGLDLSKNKADSVLNQATTAAEKATIEANKVAERAFSNNFISQIEALGDLTSNDKTMKFVSIFLTLLFLTLELAPILTKLITKRGPYEDILERTEYDLMIEQKYRISQKNAEINELLEEVKNVAKLKSDIIIRIEADKAEAELKTNKKLLEEIAAKQEILAMKSIDKWYENELKKLEIENEKI